MTRPPRGVLLLATLSLCVSLAQPAQATEVTITLPQASFERLVDQVCIWYRATGYPCRETTFSDRFTDAVEKVLSTISRGHYTLRKLGATIQVRDDTIPPPTP